MTFCLHIENDRGTNAFGCDYNVLMGRDATVVKELMM